MKPLVVFKDNQVWRWRCRRWLCEQSEFAARRDLAHQDGVQHLRSHERFGFGGKK